MIDAIVITRTFDAPPELVWAAWTTPEQFAVWFGGDQVEVPLDSVSMDVRPGGTWSARMLLPDGGQSTGPASTSTSSRRRTWRSP